MTTAQRHHCMSRIRGKNTKPELIVRKYLFSRGYRYRLNQKNLPGSPDIVMRKYKTVIFINGCFWHAHEGCRYFVIPKTRVEFWTSKFEKNRERDEKNYAQLHALGWNVVVIWECQLKPKTREHTLSCLDYILNRIFLENHQKGPRQTYQISVKA